MTIDVTSLGNRRATARWNRVAVGDMLERLTWSIPDKEIIVGREGAYGDPALRRLTARAADAYANRIANALLAAGLKSKDRVLLVSENSVDAYLTKIAVAKAGLVVAPLNPSLATDVVEHLIRRIEPALTIVDAEIWPRVAPAFAKAGVKPAVAIAIGGGPIEGTQTLAEFCANAPSTEPDVEIHGDDIFELQFTSGTTAMPRAAMLSHINAYMSASGFALTLSRGVRIESEVRLGSYLPLIYHIGGQIFGLPMFLTGGTLVIGRKPDPVQVANMIAEERITTLWGGSPTMIRALAELLEKPNAPSARTLRCFVYGWAAISPSTLASLKNASHDDLVGVEIFGQTEAIACHRFWPDQWVETFQKNCPESNYVGIPSPMLASKVVDANGESLRDKPRVVGEAVYRSPSVMAGYYKDEAGTRLAFEGGWFHSGDSCVYDEDGLRVMVDRSKDIVKTGGESVSSLRVEAVLVQHPAVARAAVVGLPDERWGEAVTAAIIKRPGVEATAEEIIAFARERLAGFETPKRVVFVEKYPETVGGKVMKHILRAELGK